MALSVIGTGFGRTGTESMKRALEMLGHGRCHHMYEVLPDPKQYDAWQAVWDGAVPDWDALYDGYAAAIDWPTAYYWRAVTAHFPEAKVLLTIRSAESWYASFSRTIAPALYDHRGAPLSRFTYQMLAVETFANRVTDAAHCKAVFNAHNDAIREAIPADRLLVYELGSGWEPLCAFLDCPVPDVSYPSGNATEEFHQRTAGSVAARIGAKPD